MKVKIYIALNKKICTNTQFENTSTNYIKSFTSFTIYKAVSHDNVSLLVFHMKGPLWTVLSIVIHIKNLYIHVHIIFEKLKENGVQKFERFGVFYDITTGNDTGAAVVHMLL